VPADVGIAQIQDALALKNITVQNFTIENAAVSVSVCPPGAWCSCENITACHIGKYNPTPGATLETNCVPYPNGSYCPTPMLSAPVSCERGAFCPNSGASAPQQCPKGFFSSFTSSFNCTESPRGSYVAVPSSSAAKPCGSGTYAASTASFDCTEGSPGSYTLGSGTLPCSKDTFSAKAGVVICTSASIGTYVAVVGSLSKAQCLLGTCPLGTFSYSVGSRV
jgi:hypothetical protein